MGAVCAVAITLARPSGVDGAPVGRSGVDVVPLPEADLVELPAGCDAVFEDLAVEDLVVALDVSALGVSVFVGTADFAGGVAA